MVLQIFLGACEGIGVGFVLLVFLRTLRLVFAVVRRRVLQRLRARTVEPEPEAESEGEPEAEPDSVLYLGALRLERYVAPLFADLHRCGIAPDGVHTLRHRDRENGADVTEFLFHDKRAAEILVSLLITTSENASTGFNSPDETWDVRARVVQAKEPCDGCAMQHIHVWVAVRTPKSAIPSLESDIHRYLYPRGIPDIADV